MAAPAADTRMAFGEVSHGVTLDGALCKAGNSGDWWAKCDVLLLRGTGMQRVTFQLVEVAPSGVSKSVSK